VGSHCAKSPSASAIRLSCRGLGGFHALKTDLVSYLSNPDVMMGTPVIACTRITVALILEKLAAGETAAQIPLLIEDTIRAALAFAADAFRADVICPIKTSPW
jgi:uncharacterized protein (DUF433 family)